MAMDKTCCTLSFVSGVEFVANVHDEVCLPLLLTKAEMLCLLHPMILPETTTVSTMLSLLMQQIFNAAMPMQLACARQMKSCCYHGGTTIGTLLLVSFGVLRQHLMLMQLLLFAMSWRKNFGTIHVQC